MTRDADADEDSGVLIVGAGFSGLCLAARLVKEGRRDFLILEKGSSVGGTWRDNRYPGCACDIPSHLYSLSFGPRPDWSRHYPTQPELRAYLEQVAAHFDLAPNLRLETALADARWDDRLARWTVTATDGRTFSAPILVSAIGALHEPEVPPLSGIEAFDGEVFHSARWPEGFDATGKDVAVVGTGASAIQFVPKIAPVARSVTIFQRTAPWVLPKFDRAIGTAQRVALRSVPGLRRLFRGLLYWLHEGRLLVFVGRRRFAGLAQRYGRRVIARAIADPAVRAVATPGYQLGCKRTLLSNDYYPALARPNVRLVTMGIDHVDTDAIVVADGMKIPAHAIIFGTGFKVVESLMSLDLRGRGGVRLRDVWRDGPSAYLGITVPGFPNFFLMLGPNTGLGHNSQIVMIEAQADHVVRALRRMRRDKAATIEVTPRAHRDFDADTQRRLAHSVWTRGGCRSWYQDRAGRVVALWPRSTFRYRQLARRSARDDYHLTVPRRSVGREATRTSFEPDR